MSLKDRVVVITGAAKGIGLALGFGVAEAGGKVAVVDAANEPHQAFGRLKEICPDLRYYRLGLAELVTLDPRLT
jgi:NAD(P)-dependent dehydrogenase (short-subunit alcohol dehydrogenase family)